jgi:hypothetical protein
LLKGRYPKTRIACHTGYYQHADELKLVLDWNVSPDKLHPLFVMETKRWRNENAGFTKSHRVIGMI